MCRHCCLSISGIHILFESDCEIIQSPEFLPFIEQENTPDVFVSIRKAENPSRVPEKKLYKDMFCVIAGNENGSIQKYFFTSCDEQDQCVITAYDPNSKHIHIEYPDAEAYSRLTLSSCFYWLGFESILLQRNKLCLHASCIETSMGGILFSGVSGIGKSTQADLWCRYRKARQINGDRPILSKEENHWRAWGSPYAGSSKVYVNDSCPLKAIVLLKQASVCSVRRLSLGEAFRGVWSGMTVHTWEESFVEKASTLAIELISNVPVLEFSCTPDEGAVEYLEQVLEKELSL